LRNINRLSGRLPILTPHIFDPFLSALPLGLSGQGRHHAQVNHLEVSMLTATYSLVFITAEQEKARTLLGKLQQYVHTAWKGLQGLDFPFLETAFGKLTRLENYCRSRKLELYLMPIFRAVSREAEELVLDLEKLRDRCTEVMRHIGEQLRGATILGAAGTSELLQSMETYCSCLFARLEREERELLPLARRVLSVEDWFAIATNFLSPDGGPAPGIRRPPPRPFLVERRAVSRSSAR
jgi:hypothetical protein